MMNVPTSKCADFLLVILSVYGCTHARVKNFKLITQVISLTVLRVNILLNCFLYSPTGKISLYLHIVLFICSLYAMVITCNVT